MRFAEFVQQQERVRCGSNMLFCLHHTYCAYTVLHALDLIGEVYCVCIQLIFSPPPLLCLIPQPLFLPIPVRGTLLVLIWRVDSKISNIIDALLSKADVCKTYLQGCKTWIGLPKFVVGRWISRIGRWMVGVYTANNVYLHWRLERGVVRYQCVARGEGGAGVES